MTAPYIDLMHLTIDKIGTFRLLPLGTPAFTLPFAKA